MGVEQRLAAAFAVLERCVAEGLVPGAAAAVGTAERTLHRDHFGQAQLQPRRRRLRADALFDCASLTKVVVTTTVLLRQLERGTVHLDQRVATLLPPFGAAGKDRLTIRQLVTHTSGLPAWRDLRAGLPPERWGQDTRRQVLEAVYRTPPQCPAGVEVVYSDLGFITLGEALSAAGGAPLDELAQREVFQPLGMAGARFNPAPDVHGRCVATEVVPERGGTVCGVVHDENAAAMGGVSGHAGLFATCADLERYCRLWLGQGQLDGERLLSVAAVDAATRDQTRLADRRGLGWVLQPNPYWVPADFCSGAAYSHTGFTGTSLLIDPAVGIFTVLLTNRVHPTRAGDAAERIRTVRARFHNAVWAAVSS